jgi:hypothetical protein
LKQQSGELTVNIGFMACQESKYFPEFQTFAFASERSLLDFDLVLWHLEFLHLDYCLESADGRQGLRKLLKDRKRRLEEVERLLKQGHNLVILFSDPVPIVKDSWERLRDYVNVQADYQLSGPWTEGSKKLFHAVADLWAEEAEEARKILEEDGFK